MKRFNWRLQRFLDIKIKQEEVIRAELVSLTEQAVGIRGQIMIRKTTLRQLLRDLGEKDACERVGKQALFLRHAQVSEDAIRKLEFKLAKIEELRQQKIVEIMEMRKFRKGLENLRDKAKEEYDQEQSKIEQNDLDDKTSISYARKIMQQV